MAPRGIYGRSKQVGARRAGGEAPRSMSGLSERRSVRRCDPVDVPAPGGRVTRRDGRWVVHVHAEAGRGDRVQRRPTCRPPVARLTSQAARDDRCLREAAPGEVHVNVDAICAVLHPAAGRTRARAELGAHNRLGGDPVDVPAPGGRVTRRDGRWVVHVHAEAGRGDRVRRRPTCRRPVAAVAGEAARDDRWLREAAAGEVHVTEDAI
mmetsp:Transcript_7990/g.19872  ORF Transcript_7990/g.19872 Transcript_7990/m.19872 type:complete len:208 (+) Transcript_7990:114-737(+)